MTQRATTNTWVEIHQIVLEKDDRAPQVPEDTRQVPLEMKVKGFLVHEAAVGEQAEIITPAGRTIKGTLVEINPPYTHMYGPPIPELLPIGEELRAILRQRGKVR
jgi:hypothetical protein